MNKLRYAAVVAALVLVPAGCSGSGDDSGSDPKTNPAASTGTKEPDQPGEPTSVPPEPTTASPSAHSTNGVVLRLAQLTTSGAVTALQRTGYRCTTDVAYMICRSGPVEVWLLTGDHKRFPVVSVHANGAVAAARQAIARRLPQVLRTVHVNEADQVDRWYEDQSDQTTADDTIGDWRVALSAEEGSDSPGVHLTLNDRRCKQHCQAE